MTLITKWSYQCNPSNPNFKSFITEPVIELKQWILAYQWKSKVVAEATNRIKQCGDGYYVSASDGHPITLEAINAYEKICFNTCFNNPR